MIFRLLGYGFSRLARFAYKNSRDLARAGHDLRYLSERSERIAAKCDTAAQTMWAIHNGETFHTASVCRRIRRK